MTIEERLTEWMYNAGKRINERKIKDFPTLNFFELRKIAVISTKIAKFVFIFAESFVMIWFFLKYLPLTLGFGYLYSVTLILLMIFGVLLFKK